MYMKPTPPLNSQLPSRWAAMGCAIATIGRNAASVRAANKNRLHIVSLSSEQFVGLRVLAREPDQSSPAPGGSCGTLRQRDGVIGAQTHGAVTRQGPPGHRGVIHEGNRRERQDIAPERRAGTERRGAADLPPHILRLSATD